jgi:hypothetical protein
MTEQDRIAAIRRGTRKTERRARRYRAALIAIRDDLDRLADRIDDLLEGDTND